MARQRINPLIPLRTRGLDGPFMQRVRRGRFVHTVGNYLTAGGGGSGEDLASFRGLSFDPTTYEAAPLTVWYTNSWDGDRPAQKKDWHIAFLLGAAQEGHQTLPATEDGIRYEFWDTDQV